jgi:hypothetical protein
MEHYKELVSHMIATEKNLEKWHQFAEVLEEAVEHFQHHEKEEFMEMKHDLHELLYGEKFDEKFARHKVSKMYHLCPEKGKMTGEKVSIEQAREYLQKYKIPTTCEWDAYVALNATYHDNKALFKKWFPEDWEEKLAEEAIEIYFKDSDAPEGKVWKVFTAY